MLNASMRLMNRAIVAASLSLPMLAHPAGAGTEAIVHSFTGSPDGQAPLVGLVNIHGTLYGTTINGGTGNVGTVFSLTPSGTEKVLHSFAGKPGDGSSPRELLNVGGVLFGTTTSGGANGKGTVFAITQAGVEKVLYSFTGGTTDGQNPYAGLANVNGTLYGTTCGGGANGLGTVFSVTKTGIEHLIYSFKGYPNDGANPVAGLTNVGGVLYGTTFYGGNVNASNANFCGSSVAGGTGIGAVFQITPAGAEKMLYAFKPRNDVSHPGAALIYAGGKLYGTASGGVFSITLNGAEKPIYFFPFQSSIGSGSGAPLTAFGGKFYGVSGYGGANDRGTVFSVTPSGVAKLVYTFQGYPTDGSDPVGALLSLGGKLYGTTSGGGSKNQGIVFSVTP